MNQDVKAIGKLAAIGLGLLVLFVGLGIATFFYASGTAYVKMTGEVTVLDRDSGLPVPNCLLTFERGQAFGAPTTRTRTGTKGRAAYDAGEYVYRGAKADAFRYDRTPELQIYLGEQPGAGTDEAERWTVRLTFKQPWLDMEVAPTVSVRRSLARVGPGPSTSEGQEAPLRFVPLEPGTEREVARAHVRFDTQARRTVYRIALTLLLDAGQIAACQASDRPAY
jgi:hypothetical protein